MFKAKLIANPYFVFFRKHSLLIFFLLAIVNSIVINMLLNEGFELKILLLTMPAYLLLYYLTFKFNRKISQSVQSQHVELDSQSVTIYNKEGKADLYLPKSSIEYIVLKKDYKFEDSFMREMLNQFKGKSNYHFVQIYSGNHWYTIRFMLDSHYMEAKLNAYLSEWIAEGMPVHYSKEPIHTATRLSGLNPVK